MSINNKKTVVLSRFLCYQTIINDKLGDDERHYKCSKYNTPNVCHECHWSLRSLRILISGRCFLRHNKYINIFYYEPKSSRKKLNDTHDT